MQKTLLELIDHVQESADAAELSVMGSLCSTYAKSAMILEQCDETVQESFKDDLKAPVLGSKDESMGKRILMAVPRMFAKLVEMIKRLIKRFTDKNNVCERICKDLKKKLDNIETDKTVESFPEFRVSLYLVTKTGDVNTKDLDQLSKACKHIEDTIREYEKSIGYGNDGFEWNTELVKQYMTTVPKKCDTFVTTLKSWAAKMKSVETTDLTISSGVAKQLHDIIDDYQKLFIKKHGSIGPKWAIDYLLTTLKTKALFIATYVIGSGIEETTELTSFHTKEELESMKNKPSKTKLTADMFKPMMDFIGSTLTVVQECANMYNKYVEHDLMVLADYLNDITSQQSNYENSSNIRSIDKKVNYTQGVIAGRKYNKMARDYKGSDKKED